MRCHTAGLGSSPFARRYWGNRCYFLFLQVLRCFSSPRSPCAIRAMSGSLPTGCPIRTSGGHGAFATRPGFSQLVTSFFASESLGIPHAPFSFRLYLCFLLRGSPLSPEPKFDNVRLWFARSCETRCVSTLLSRYIRFTPHTSASSLVNVLF